MENLDLSELENIKNMLLSTDEETIKLAIGLCETIPEVHEHLYDFFYFPGITNAYGLPVIYQLESIKLNCTVTYMGKYWAYMFVYYHVIMNILKDGKHITYLNHEK